MDLQYVFANPRKGVGKKKKVSKMKKGAKKVAKKKVKKKPSAAQLRARRAFAKAAKSGKLKKGMKLKGNPKKKKVIAKRRKRKNPYETYVIERPIKPKTTKARYKRPDQAEIAKLSRQAGKWQNEYAKLSDVVNKMSLAQMARMDKFGVNSSLPKKFKEADRRVQKMAKKAEIAMAKYDAVQKLLDDAKNSGYNVSGPKISKNPRRKKKVAKKKVRRKVRRKKIAKKAKSYGKKRKTRKKSKAKRGVSLKRSLPLSFMKRKRKSARIRLSVNPSIQGLVEQTTMHSLGEIGHLVAAPTVFGMIDKLWSLPGLSIVKSYTVDAMANVLPVGYKNFAGVFANIFQVGALAYVYDMFGRGKLGQFEGHIQQQLKAQMAMNMISVGGYIVQAVPFLQAPFGVIPAGMGMYPQMGAVDFMPHGSSVPAYDYSNQAPGLGQYQWSKADFGGVDYTAGHEHDADFGEIPEEMGVVPNGLG